MICKRCGAECGSEDKFCRICGAKFKPKRKGSAFPAPESTRFSEPVLPGKPDDFSAGFSEPLEAPGKSARKKRFAFVSAVVLLLIVLAAAIWILIPQFKQSFMSPAAFYIDSEARQTGVLIETLSSEMSSATARQKAEVSGVISLAAEGGEFDEETRDLLDRVNFLVDVRIDENGNMTLDCGASFDNKLFCSVFATLIEDEFTLRFPELTSAQVTQKLSAALAHALSLSGDAVLETATGCSRADLKAWISGYLHEILRPALDEAEQVLDTTELDGIPTSTVTFTLSEKTVKKLLRDFAKRFRRDETLVTICEHLTEYLGGSEAFKGALIEEFNLSGEDLEAFPFLTTAKDSIDSTLSRHRLFADPKTDVPLLFAYGTDRDAIRAQLESRAERIIDHADDLSVTEPVSLTVYYQGTGLVGRKLEKGGETLFSAFCLVKDDKTDFSLSFADGDHLYTLSAQRDLSGGTLHSEFEFSRRSYVTEEGVTAYDEPEKLWTLSCALEPNTPVGGVRTICGEVKLNQDNEILTLANEKISDTDTLLTYERRTVSEKGSSKIKLRANLTYSAQVKQEEALTQVTGKRFDRDAFEELVAAMKAKLSDTPILARLFGEEKAPE